MRRYEVGSPSPRKPEHSDDLGGNFPCSTDKAALSILALGISFFSFHPGIPSIARVGFAVAMLKFLFACLFDDKNISLSQFHLMNAVQCIVFPGVGRRCTHDISLVGVCPGPENPYPISDQAA